MQGLRLDRLAAFGMKALTAQMTRYRDKLEGRSGTLWESRYKSSVVQSDTYLLACCRYIELNPVRARMVGRADDYSWSSYRARIGVERDDWLDCDPCYLALGATEGECRERYMDFVHPSDSRCGIEVNPRGITARPADG